PGHTLVYMNAAFSRLAGLTGGDPGDTSIATLFDSVERVGLVYSLDRALHERVELVDQVIDTSSERGSPWRCSVWPVIGPGGNVESLGLEIRETGEPDAAITLQRQVAEQMLLGALRERGLAEDAEA